LDRGLRRQARRERLDQQFQIAVIDDGDGLFWAMPPNVALTLVGVTRLSHREVPSEIDLIAVKNW